MARDPRLAQRQAAARSIRAFEGMVQRTVERAFTAVAEEFTREVIAPRLVDVNAAAAPGDPFSDADAAVLRAAWEAQIADILEASEVVYMAALEEIARDLAVAVESLNIAPHVDAYLREARNRLVRVGDELWESARARIVEGSLEGLSIPEIAESLREAFGEHGEQIGLSRAIRIARTETVSGWNAGGHDTVNALPSELQPQFQTWLCVAPDTLVEASGVTHAARRHYVGPMVTIRVASGRSITVTPEHPVLTGRGWLRADLVDEADHLFQVGGRDPAVSPDVDDAPARIGEVVDSAMQASPVQVRTMRVPVHFDGDGARRDVEVVPANCDLAANLKPRGDERIADLFLTGADCLAQALVFRGRDLLTNGCRNRSAAIRGASGCDRVPGSVLPGGGLVADRHVGLFEDSHDRALGDAEVCGQLPRGSAVSVAADQVVAVDVVAFSGHVYDLSTGVGWYSANGLAVHNCTLDTRTRDSHFAADGQTVPLSSPFMVGGFALRFPGDPLGPPQEVINCFPGDTLVSAPSGIRRVYRHWYEGPLITVRTVDGVEVSATPNHPLLTSRGWVAAQDVEVGEHLIGSPVGQRVSLGDPDVENAPATFEQVYAAAHETGVSRRIVGGRVDFHGDVVDGEVEVVSADPLLDFVVDPVDEPARCERFGDEQLVGLEGRQRLGASVRSASSVVVVGDVGVGPGVISPARGVRSGCEGLPVLERRVGHADTQRFTASARGDAGGDEPWANGRPRDAEAVREGLLRFTGEIAAHEVVDVDVSAFGGHVYNLETGDGWYIANDIAASNCRCTTVYGDDPEPPTDEGRQYLSDERIAEIIEHFEERGVVRESVTAAAEEHTSGMIALVPSGDDAARLAVEGGEDPGELHVTLAFLGEAAEWTAAQREDLIEELRAALDYPGAVEGEAFGVNHWNPHGEDPCWVYSIGGLRVAQAHADAWQALNELLRADDAPVIPEQHAPWAAHLTAGYSNDRGMFDAMLDRLGPVTFDRVRVAFAGRYTDIPLTRDAEHNEEAAVTADANSEGRVRRWSTPGETALAFENQQTGDGRVFAPGALYWEGDSWPLQYARQMLGGHAGAELVGPIDALMRDGDRIVGAGGLYVDTEAGAEAAALYDQGAPLGVSVDLDDVDVEVVDNRPAEDREADDDGGDVVLLASLDSASVLDLGGGRWSIRPGEVRVHTASGMPRHASLAELVESVGLSVTAAAGDSDPAEGEILFEEKAGEVVLRITRGRLRGATLVSMPAFAEARIVLNDSPAADAEGEVEAAAVTLLEQVVRYVSQSPTPQSAAQVADGCGVDVEQARGALGRAVDAGELRRVERGLYAGVSGLPEGDVVAAVTSDAPSDEAASGFVMPDMAVEASAWDEFRAIPPMPAEWFAEPTPDELGATDGGFHYDNGRIYGWVAQKGVCHDGYTNECLMIDDFGNFDLTTFLRAKIDLDNGDEVAVGVFTMNTGHHNDGANVRSMQRQFDDTRTVAGIVTVGLNDRGLWFSGAAAPWLSEWDLQVFNTCRPSGHWKQERNGRWSLRAVLSVPVPGYPNRLAASAFVHRSNMALAASAGTPMPEPVEAELEVAASAGTALDAESMRVLASAVVDEMERREQQRREFEEIAEMMDQARAEVVASLRAEVVTTHQEGN